MKSRGRRSAILLPLLLLAFALRVHRIGEQRVWWDEGWSVWVARFSPLEILRQTGNDVHPPLYFELLHVWRALSGDSEAGLRLLSAFLGLLTVAMTYALGRRMARGTLSPPAATLAGVLAALFLTVSRFTIAWSQEIRMYALASLLAVLAVWAARRVWAHGGDGGRRRDGAIYILATTGGLYTLYLFAPVWAAINVAWLWSWRAAADRRRTFLRWAALQFAVLALFLPWLWYASSGFLSTASATPIRLFDFLHIYWTVLTVGIPVDVAQFNWLTLPAAAVFLVAVVAVAAVAAAAGRRPPADDRPRTSGLPSADDDRPSPHPPFTPSPLPPFFPRQDLTLLLAILLIPAIIVYIVSLPRQNFYNPPFNPRYLVIFTPFYSILLAWGLAAIDEWVGRRFEKGRKGEREKGSDGRRSTVVTLLLAAFMVGVALVGLWPYYPGRVLLDDFPSLVSTIDAHRQPGDAVVLYTDTDWPVFAYHHPAAWIGVPHQWAMTPDTAADFLAPIWEGHDAVWLVTTPYSAGSDPQRYVPAWLGERAAAVREFTYEDMALTLFARTDTRAASADQLTQSEPPNALDVPLAGGGVLTGYAQAARDFKSGDTIHLFLHRAAGDEITTQVGLIDDRDVVFAPKTITLPTTASAARQQVDLIVPPEAPSGRYRFFIIDADGRVAPFGRANITQKDATLLTIDDVTIANRVDAPFAEGIRLLGYDLAAATARPGESISLRLYWTSDGNISRPYKVFTHLLGDVFNAGGGNFLWGQADNEPAANTRPTTTWRAGEVIVDEYAIPIAPDAPPGTYRIEIGLYDPLTGQRLSLPGPDGAADHVVLTEIVVE